MNPLQAFLVDLAEGAVYGAALALLALPDATTNGKAALFVVIGGAIGGVKAVARRGLIAYTDSRKPS